MALLLPFDVIDDDDVIIVMLGNNDGLGGDDDAGDDDDDRDGLAYIPIIPPLPLPIPLLLLLPFADANNGSLMDDAIAAIGDGIADVVDDDDDDGDNAAMLLTLGLVARPLVVDNRMALGLRIDLGIPLPPLLPFAVAVENGADGANDGMGDTGSLSSPVHAS